MIFYLIVGLIVTLINALANFVNDIKFEIPIWPYPEIDFGDFIPTLDMPTFPSFGVIPYVGIEDVRIFKADRIVILWILDVLNIGFPFGK